MTTMFNNEPDPVAVAQARAEERTRIKAIMDLPEASNRATLALNLALQSDMSVAAAKNTLASAAPEPVFAAQPGPGANADRSQEIGPAGASALISAEHAKAGWAKSIGSINSRIQAGDGKAGMAQIRG